MERLTRRSILRAAGAFAGGSALASGPSMSAPDLFALGSRQDDAELIEAERELDKLSAESAALLLIENPPELDGNGYPVGWQDLRDQVMALDALIHQKPAHTPAGAAVKLRRILAPEVGMQDCGAMDSHYDSLRHILALVERLAAGGAAISALDLTDPGIVALRCECEALAAEYRLPLPEGDQGLVEAVRRELRLRPRKHAIAETPVYTMQTEDEIVNPIVDPARSWLEGFIEDTPAQGLLGVAAKLRYAMHWSDDGLSIDDVVDVAQLLDVVERELAS